MSVMNKEELSELILQNQKEMYVLAYSILQNQSDAQDAVSECIVRAFENRTSLRKTCKCKILADKDSDQCIPFSNHKNDRKLCFLLIWNNTSRLQKSRKIIYGQQFWNCRKMCGLSWFSIIMTVFR